MLFIAAGDGFQPVMVPFPVELVAEGRGSTKVQLAGMGLNPGAPALDRRGDATARRGKTAEAMRVEKSILSDFFE